MPSGLQTVSNLVAVGLGVVCMGTYFGNPKGAFIQGGVAAISGIALALIHKENSDLESDVGPCSLERFCPLRSGAPWRPPLESELCEHNSV